MRALVIIAIVATGCWYDLDSQPKPDAGSSTCTTGTSVSCTNVQPMLSSIQTNVFDQNLCNAGACHDGNTATPQGKVDLRDGMSFAHLVNFGSILTAGDKLAVPSQPTMSYLLVMIGKLPPTPTMPVPGSVGLMPQNAGTVLCCQKLDAIDQWIMNGAMNN